jgi:sulfoxide reductase catalytic subunit YedY
MSKGWFRESYGKKLVKLHRYNAWIVLALAVSGIILWVPSIRGDLGAWRVALKWLHIIVGIVSIVLIALYVPLISKHWKQIRQKAAQRWNLGIVLALLIGWSLSGLVLWQFRNLPTSWSNTALILHDLFTWVGIPYAVYHSISRMRWVKEAQRQALLNRTEDEAAASGAAAVPAGQPRLGAQAFVEMLKRSPMTRAAFIRWGVGLLLVFGIGPSFFRWLRDTAGPGGGSIDGLVASDGNHMVPAPTPLAASLPPSGGGLKGDFRIYTVTPIPVFSSDKWQFVVAGLVEQPLSFDWKQFLELKRTVQVSDFHCVTGWSVYHITWEGIPLTKLLEMAKLKPQAKFVKLYSGDREYTDCLSLEQAGMDDVMVAVMMDGKPIPQQLGGPVRLVVPKMYAYKSVKWLQAIELIDKEHYGYWEVRGYDNDAWVNSSNGYGPKGSQS